MWLVLLCIHLIGLVGFNLILRKSALGKIDKLTLATIMQTGIAIPAVVLIFLYPPNFSIFSLTDFILLGFTIVLGIGLQVANVKALQYLEASVFSIIYNLRIVLTTLLGILLLGETTDVLRILGGVFILLAIITVKQRGSKITISRGVMWAVAAAVILSLLNVSEKSLINTVGFLNYFPTAVLVAAVLMWAYILITKRVVDKKILLQPRMLQLMIFRALSGYGFSLALAAGALISVANYISGMSVILIVIIGAVWLGERDYLGRKILATVVAMVGITIILLSGI